MEGRSLLPELEETLGRGGFDPFAEVVIGQSAGIGTRIAAFPRSFCCSGAARV
jgi:hypothetical protein